MQTCGILDAELPSSAYDVVAFWHVLEHLDDPVAALHRVRPTLRPGGCLIIEVPNWSSLIARLTGSYWFHLDLPRHRVHFTPASLRRAVALADFRVIRLEHIPNPHGLAGAMGYRGGDSCRWQGERIRNAVGVQMIGWAAGLLTAALRRSDVIRLTALTDR